jgi:hypothetical protein
MSYLPKLSVYLLYTLDTEIQTKLRGREGSAERVVVVFRNKLYGQKPEYTEVAESSLQSLIFLIFPHK